MRVSYIYLHNTHGGTQKSSEPKDSGEENLESEIIYKGPEFVKVYYKLSYLDQTVENV